MSFSGVQEEVEVPAPAPGSDTLEAKAEAQASMEAWNVSLSELNNPENDEDASPSREAGCIGWASRT